MNNPLLEGLEETVRRALEEDIGSGDITAELVPAEHEATATVICRQHATLCGKPWINAVFNQVDPGIQVDWQQHDGDSVSPQDVIFIARGKSRSLLTAERTALNFLQTLSSVATSAKTLADLVQHTSVKILDTRKTIPGLRLAQKYAVQVGGCSNHRIGLFDAFLIKENHIKACANITNAIENARKLHPDRQVEVEVETHDQLREALTAGADSVLLDNHTLEMLHEAVKINNGKAKLEASGGYTIESAIYVAQTGVDYISFGSLTKHIQATDFTMLFS
ncbi:MAG: carboxylating nicotinate-nucleotide diphosphorylase [Gammaproteobacteria bacterium]|nr:carboxylating nicotinate-nucleotide diphosphorylase [Gammaproteobacteria bacterium]